MNSITVIIPVYNAELTLLGLYQQLIPAMESITTNFEVIFVEDCGKDKSWRIIQELANMDQRIKGIKLSKNYGQHNALLCGIRAATKDIIITMDDDLQNPVSEISILINKLKEGYDVVYGYPEKGQHGLFRNLASRITKRVLQGAMGVDTARHVSAFRAFYTRLRGAFVNYHNSTVSIDVLLTWATSNFSTAIVKHSPRTAGQSNYTLPKLIIHALNLLTGFSALPLQLASALGIIFTIFGLGVLSWVIAMYFMYGAAVPGFPFLASIIAIFSGVQLFVLGIFGEYLARIHFRTLDRPTYLVWQTTQQNEGLDK